MDREAAGREGLIPRVDVLGVHVSAINLDIAAQVFRTWIEDGDRQYVCVTGVHGVIESQDDPVLLRIHNNSGLTTPDGMPLVWCGRYAGLDWMDRVYGPDLMLRICEDSVSRGWSHFFYGAGPGVAEELATRLRERFPGLKVAGTYSPPFGPMDDVEMQHVVQLLNDADPDIVWVGLSTPKQERWMADMRETLQARVLVGVGAAFDIHAGRTRQAPPWMRRSGLEWFFRLVTEPRRLWQRYFRIVPRFMLSIAHSRPRFVSDVEDARLE